MNRKSRRAADKQLRSADVKNADGATTQILIDRAVVAAQAGNWLEAEKILRHLLSVDAAHAEALHLMGMALGSTDRMEEGIDYLKRATALKPAEALYWSNLSTCYLGAFRHAEAIEAARKAVTLEPGYVLAWSRLGDAYFDFKAFEKAREAYERVLALAGPALDTIKRVAHCHMNLGQLERAEATLRTAQDLAPGDIETLGNLGTILVARRQFAAAIPCLEQATEQGSGKYSIAINYARALAGVGDREKAIRWLRKATAMDHREVEAWLMLANLQLEAGDLAEAKIAAKRAIDLAPGNQMAQDLAGRILPAAPAAILAKAQPTVWDFHLGEADEAPVAVGGLDVTFGDQPQTKGVAANGVATAVPAKESEAVKPKPVVGGIVDLTTLKIG